jgi:excisionase family DNA binding protein
MSNHQDDPKDTFSTSEAAALVGVHTVTVARWCNAELVEGAQLTSEGWRIPKAAAATLQRLTQASYTIDQVSKAWQVSRRTVERLLKSGHLSCWRLPSQRRGAIRIPESAILAFESSNQSAA